MSATALHADVAARIVTLKSRRDTIETQIMRVIQGGQAFGGAGLVQVSQVPLSELRKELERVKREILRLTAGADITSLRPDFGDADTITDEETLT